MGGYDEATVAPNNTYCLPIATCSPTPTYDPCLNPCTDPCLNPNVYLGQNATTIGPQPNPQPAYVQPTVAPNVFIPRNRAAAYSTAPGTRGIYAGRLQLDPQRLIAPVGSEVILRAGLCGDDGYLINKQPIEWSLSQDSVGSFVEVDEFKKPFWRRMLQRPPEKKSGDYAIGRTSTASQVLTRGTLDPSDDIWLAEGQTWLSLTSASEGVSHVSAVAPSAAGWGERRQTSTIYWIDGRWQFPPPTAGRIGEPRQITTNVRRTTTGNPIQGWIVRYEVVDNSSADLANAKRTLDVVTDPLGNATVNVSPLNNAPGVTQVGIQVFRVGNRVGDYDRILVGQGQTSITWTDSLSTDPYPGQLPSSPPADDAPTIPANTPRLNINISGPATVASGQVATYRINVNNTGTTPAPNTQLSVKVPYGMEYVDSPNGNLFDDNVRWDLQTVPPQGRAVHQVTLRAVGGGPFSVCAQTDNEQSITGRDCVETTVSQANTPPANPTPTGLDVNMSEGPSAVRVGDQVRYRVTLKNPFNQIARVNVRDEFDPGLGHIQGGSPIEYPLNLGPGEVKEILLDFTAKTPGQQCHTLTVTANLGAAATKRACVNVVGSGTQLPGNTGPPDPDPFQAGQVSIASRTLRNSLPATAFQVGETVRIEFEVVNTGSVPLSNLQIIDEYDPTLFPIAALPDQPGRDQVDRNRLVWNIAQLDPGRKSQFLIDARVDRPATVACHTLKVISQGQSIGQREACVRIPDDGSAVGVRLQPPANALDVTHQQSLLEPMTPVSMRVISNRTATELNLQPSHQSNARNNDYLRVNVADLGDPAYVDKHLTYVVVVRNNRKTSDRDVVLTVTLPEGARYESSINPPMIRARKTTPDRRTVEFLPIAELRGDETATFRIVVTSQRSGTGVFRAEVISARAPLPIVVTEETTFYAN